MVSRMPNKKLIKIKITKNYKPNITKKTSKKMYYSNAAQELHYAIM